MTKRKKPISAEEFAAWREDPVTQWVVAELAKASEAQKAAWIEQSWERTDCDPILLTELKTRGDAYSALAEMTYEDLAEIAE